MKFEKLMLPVLALVTSLSALADVAATERVYETSLTQFTLDKRLESQLGNLSAVYSGHIALNYTKKEANLTLYRRFSCPRNQVCLAVMPTPIFMNFKIVSQKTNECGIKVVTATFNGEGTSRVLEVADTRKSRCPTFTALEPTMLTLKYTYSEQLEVFEREVTTYSTMSGDALVYLPLKN